MTLARDHHTNETTPARVPHVTRPVHYTNAPVLVVIRVRRHVPKLRSYGPARVLKHCFVNGKERFGLRVIQFAVRDNAIYLIVEAHAASSLTRGMKGLGVRVAKQLNKFMGRRGAVLADRYDAQDLLTARAVRDALAFVLDNRRHRGHGPFEFDLFSSAAYFDGWRRPCDCPRSHDPPVVPATLWLLTCGWRHLGLIAPGGPARAAPA